MVRERLSRDLGLFSLVSISMGAMMGAGIFILPGVAASISGPSVVLAFVIAGVVAMTSAFSMSEMATAMPIAGGAYVYITRSMGPLPGTIMGWGVWFSLILKSAFALVGLGVYMSLFVDVEMRYISLFLACLLLGVNVVGTKYSGRLQSLIVFTATASLAALVLLSVPHVDTARYSPMMTSGITGLLAATSLVFVSYIGLTNIASLAEEVRKPEKSIPRAMFISLGVMMALYALVTASVVGVLEHEHLYRTYTPIYDTASAVVNPAFGAVLGGVAIAALISMANAGIITSSRYPFAMGRDQLMPSWLLHISPRFSTPSNSIAFTGIVILALIATVDVVNLAKLASAFTMLVFIFVNAAVLIFRFVGPEWYRPKFRSLGYPYIQIAGILAALVLMAMSGMLSLLFVAGFFVFGTLWFFFYGKERVSFKGAFEEAVIYMKRMHLKHVASAKIETGTVRIMIPLEKMKHGGDLLRMAKLLTTGKRGVIYTVRFKEVPFQTPLTVVKKAVEGLESEFEARTRKLAEEIGAEVEIYEVLTHSWKESVVSFAEEYGINMILLDWEEEFHRMLFHGSDTHWIMENAPCDVLIFKDRGIDIKKIMVMTTGDVFKRLCINIVNSIASARGAEVTCLQTVESESTMHRKMVERYHRMLGDVCTPNIKTSVVPLWNLIRETEESAKDVDLLVLGTTEQRTKHLMFGAYEDKILEHVDCSVLVVHSRERCEA